ncbi:hypothetical protein ACFOYW_10660 [Gryllotalpicola reticulitermitis]|uniref:Uncharacterized protein n=1 Tax=Gryllotalpicola reticulitermitis TaxID=1184153 RepID=A0ABV8Q8S1_9MICO
MITADGTRESVHAFAQAVRDALADLPADEVDELTDGLEADLTERADEVGGTDAFGDPTLYADELRASAGLPPRSETPRRSIARELRAAIVASSAALANRLRANPLASWLLDIAVALRPLWWAARGWAVWQLVTLVVWHTSYGLIPVYESVSANAGQWLILLALVIVSVQWGRGRWLPRRWAPALTVLANVGTVLVILPVAAFAVNDSHASYVYASSAESQPAATGLYSSGQQVFNIYAYGADGQPLDNVRLYDQDGHPLYTVPDPSSASAFTVSDNGNAYDTTRSPLADGLLGWAVYPLANSGGSTPPAPYAHVQPLSGSASATPTPTPTPRATPTPTPTPSGAHG